MHDPRVGRFFATDPLAVDYPHNSPYAFSENRVLDRNELEGLETGPQYWMAYTPAARQAGMTPKMFEKQNASLAGERLVKALEEKVTKANHRAKAMSTFYNQHKHLLSRDEKLTFGTAQIYFYSYFTEFGGYTDAEDVSVIMEGKTIDGSKATGLDYSLAGIGAFIPFVSGGAFKQLVKNIDNHTLQFAIKKAGKVEETGEAVLNNGVLELDFNVRKELQGKGIGSNMFDQAIKMFGDKVKKVQGLWTDGVNLDIYNKAVKEGKTPTEAAFETATGKWAKKNGFDKVEIIQDIKMKDGSSGSVKVHFSKSVKKKS